jgi:glycerophosphoryl diester phosphodiesterase
MRDRRLSLSLAAALLALLALAGPAAAASNPWRVSPTWNIAHQGGEDEFPSNTMYAFKRALKGGADMLELDIGVTSDNHVVVMHDTTLDRVSNGTGTIASHTLAQIEKLDGAYWFSRTGPNHYRHDLPARDYPFRGIATGKRKPPKGYKRSDFRVTTLAQVLRAFPRTPINVEIKGRTKAEDVSEYLENARVLAAELNQTTRRDIIVVSFKQQAVDLFHQLDPAMPVAPGIDGSAAFLLSNQSPGEGVVAFQLPITYLFGGSMLNVTTADNVARAHAGGYAWHTWFGDDDKDDPATWRTLISWCVDGVMTARPIAFERVLRATKPPAACAVPRG